MVYKAFVGWGFWGASTSAQRANYFSSWGMMSSLPGAVASSIISLATYFYRMLKG
jgi:hypothetical protein